MDISELKILLRETGLSAEELGKVIGVSGMTVRRWIDTRGGQKLAPIYQQAIRDSIIKLFLKGYLSWESPLLEKAMAQWQALEQLAILKALGFAEGFDCNSPNVAERTIIALTQIGSAESRRKRVDRGRDRIVSLVKEENQWREKIHALLEVIDSPSLPSVDKFAAYGALFYFAMPFTMVKSSLPVFAEMDIFAILTVAESHYLRKNELPVGPYKKNKQ